MAYQLILPDIGEGVVEAEVQKWFVKPGDEVAEDQPLVEVMTDKATVTIPSPKRGRVTRLLWKEGEVARVHAPLLEMELEVAATGTGQAHAASVSLAAPVAHAPPPLPTPAAVTATVIPIAAAAPAGNALAAPAVRALARQLGIDINTVAGSGPGGRVTKQDLEATTGASGGPARGALALPSSRPPASGERRIEVVPVRGLRRRISEKMAQSKRTAAHFTFVEQVDATDLLAVKERIAAKAAGQGVKVTFLPFIVKAVVAALREHPWLNASLDEAKGEIQVKRWYDIGIASATDQGLVVPVVRSADQLSLLDIAREIERLSADTKAGKGRPEDMGGSTFTITSLGALGGLFATPIINTPEVAILGVHRMRPTPLVKDGAIAVRQVMHLSLSFDHRVIDGHVGAAFTYAVIERLEDPSLLFMDMA
jgi:pyruvate dehydrogenase E2 component (dihydrolipoamide acetyltransferase)